MPPRSRDGRADPLAEYRAKRDPARTAEPVPDAGCALPIGNDDAFVVQEHHTPYGSPAHPTGERVHWDLRLERDGVLKSWAVPKGPPTKSGTNRLAVPTEDHPLAYATFTGEIAAGEYGGGHVTIWDAGRYATEKWDERHVIVTFDGRRLAGRYALFPLSDGAWNIRKLDDTPPVGNRDAPPVGNRNAPPVENRDTPPVGNRNAPPVGNRDTPPVVNRTRLPLPMLATAGELPDVEDDARWGYEFKWDGVRAVAGVQGGLLTLTSRKGTDIAVRYPEVARLPDALAGHDAVLDGEIVAMDAAGRPDFGALQNRMHRTGPEVLAMAAADPVTYLVFDLLSLDGEDLLSSPYARRRDLLDTLGLAGHRWVSTPWFAGGGTDVLAASQENGLEGVVAKRLASVYRPGLRSPDWRKIKNIRTQAVVVGGWRPGQGRRAGTIGSLLVGVPDDEGRLVYVGHVGTGFRDQDLRDLQRTFTARATPPFEGALQREVTRDAHWVEPDLVGEVAYAVWTADRRLRHPAWRGVRDDLEPDDVVVEP